MYLAVEKFGRSVSRKDVIDVVKACARCAMVDPSPVRWDHGGLAVQESWDRVAVDLVHAQGCIFLSLIIWRLLSAETTAAVVGQ